MRGEPYQHDTFCAEVKNYAKPGDQGAHFDEFLAKCYVAAQIGHHLSDHFMWITWSPFRANSWSTLNSPEQVQAAVLQHSDRVLGTSDQEEAQGLLDSNLAKSVAERLWLIVLSDKQETLLPLRDWASIVAAELVRRGEQW
jgi:hypothetical protein